MDKPGYISICPFCFFYCVVYTQACCSNLISLRNYLKLRIPYPIVTLRILKRL